jgi:hypothetical protein
MSELRDNLEKLRDEYRSHRYPGSLAADVARRPATARRWTLGRIAAAASVITALAAAVVMWMSIEPAVTPVAPSPGGESAIAAAVEINDLGAMPAMPDELPLVPAEAEAISEIVPSLSDLGSMPEMPSMSLDLSYGDDTQSSEDSV